MNMEQDASDAVIVRSTIELGRSLGLSVVAEGVETAANSDRAKQLGCATRLQGFYLLPAPCRRRRSPRCCSCATRQQQGLAVLRRMTLLHGDPAAGPSQTLGEQRPPRSSFRQRSRSATALPPTNRRSCRPRVPVMPGPALGTGAAFRLWFEPSRRAARCRMACDFPQQHVVSGVVRGRVRQVGSSAPDEIRDRVLLTSSCNGCSDPTIRRDPRCPSTAVYAHRRLSSCVPSSIRPWQRPNSWRSGMRGNVTPARRPRDVPESGCPRSSN